VCLLSGETIVKPCVKCRYMLIVKRKPGLFQPLESDKWFYVFGGPYPELSPHKTDYDVYTGDNVMYLIDTPYLKGVQHKVRRVLKI
jgi:hypothetical protein